MKRIKIGLIGLLNAHACWNFESILKLKDKFDFVGMCPDYTNDDEMSRGQMSADGIKLRLESIEKKFGKIPVMTLDELLNYPGLEAVAIESLEDDPVKFALPAADKGLHIFMDKPGGQDLEAFRKLIGIMKEKNLVLSMGYMYRQNPAVQELFRMVAGGELGRVTCVEAHMDCDHDPQTREWLGTFRGGMMYWLGCHLVDLILKLQGMPDEIIPMNMCTHLDGVTAEDYGMTVLRYKNGLSFAKTSAAEYGGFMRRQLVVCGTEGTVEIKPLERYESNGNVCADMRVVTRKNDSKDGWNALGKTVSYSIPDRYDGMLREFAEIIRGEKENPNSLDYELKLLETVLKCSGVISVK